MNTHYRFPNFIIDKKTHFSNYNMYFNYNSAIWNAPFPLFSSFSYITVQTSKWLLMSNKVNLE